MEREKPQRISLTVEVPSIDAIWISKLFAMRDESIFLVSQDGSEAGRKLDEIKEIINSYQLKTKTKASF